MATVSRLSPYVRMRRPDRMPTGTGGTVVVFPRCPAQRETSVTVQRKSPSRKVLLAHSDLEERSLIEAALLDRGYQVSTCRNGEEALEQICANRFDLLITAIAMSRIDGLELLRALRHQTPALPAIAVSEGLREIDGVYLRNAELLGAVATHLHPVAPHVLLKSVETALESTPDTSS